MPFTPIAAHINHLEIDIPLLPNSPLKVKIKGIDALFIETDVGKVSPLQIQSALEGWITLRIVQLNRILIGQKILSSSSGMGTIWKEMIQRIEIHICDVHIRMETCSFTSRGLLSAILSEVDETMKQEEEEEDYDQTPFVIGLMVDTISLQPDLDDSGEDDEGDQDDVIVSRKRVEFSNLCVYGGEMESIFDSTDLLDMVYDEKTKDEVKEEQEDEEERFQSSLLTLISGSSFVFLMNEAIEGIEGEKLIILPTSLHASLALHLTPASPASIGTIHATFDNDSIEIRVSDDSLSFFAKLSDLLDYPIYDLQLKALSPSPLLMTLQLSSLSSSFKKMTTSSQQSNSSPCLPNSVRMARARWMFVRDCVQKEMWRETPKLGSTAQRWRMWFKQWVLASHYSCLRKLLYDYIWRDPFQDKSGFDRLKFHESLHFRGETIVGDIDLHFLLHQHSPEIDISPQFYFLSQRQKNTIFAIIQSYQGEENGWWLSSNGTEKEEDSKKSSFTEQRQFSRQVLLLLYSYYQYLTALLPTTITSFVKFSVDQEIREKEIVDSESEEGVAESVKQIIQSKSHKLSFPSQIPISFFTQDISSKVLLMIGIESCEGLESVVSSFDLKPFFEACLRSDIGMFKSFLPISYLKTHVGNQTTSSAPPPQLNGKDEQGSNSSNNKKSTFQWNSILFFVFDEDEFNTLANQSRSNHHENNLGVISLSCKDQGAFFPINIGETMITFEDIQMSLDLSSSVVPLHRNLVNSSSSSSPPHLRFFANTIKLSSLSNYEEEEDEEEGTLKRLPETLNDSLDKMITSMSWNDLIEDGAEEEEGDPNFIHLTSLSKFLLSRKFSTISSSIHFPCLKIHALSHYHWRGRIIEVPVSSHVFKRVRMDVLVGSFPAYKFHLRLKSNSYQIVEHSLKFDTKKPKEKQERVKEYPLFSMYNIRGSVAFDEMVDGGGEEGGGCSWRGKRYKFGMKVGMGRYFIIFKHPHDSLHPKEEEEEEGGDEKVLFL